MTPLEIQPQAWKDQADRLYRAGQADLDRRAPYLKGPSTRGHARNVRCDTAVAPGADYRPGPRGRSCG